MAAFHYLLDTNILSDLIRHPAGPAARRIGKVGEETVCTSIVAACELRFGALKKGSAKLSARVETILSLIAVLPLDVDADRRYAEIRTFLEEKGLPIGPNDMLLAAHALSLDLTLVTANLAEFARVPGLSVQNWL